MYKFLLCWRYLRTRYIALASIVSVMLGVATMIVVNSVMAGFSHEMQTRIKGILSDVVFEVPNLNGFHDADAHMRQIRKIAGEHIAGMTPTVHVPAMLSFRYGGQWITRPVQVVGIDVETKGDAGDYAQYLNHPLNREKPSWKLHEQGYDLRDHQAGAEAPERSELGNSGKLYREWRIRRERAFESENQRLAPENGLHREASEPVVDPPLAPELALPADIHAVIPVEAAGDLPTPSPDSENPFGGRPDDSPKHDELKDQYTGIVLGFALATYRGPGGRDHFMAMPGDDVKLTLPTAGTPPRAIDDSFTVVDLYESKMNEYDSSFVFVPIEKLQKLRGMFDPTTGVGNINAIQIRLKDPSKAELVRDLLQRSKAFPPGVYVISTWKDKQGPLLAAVQMETAILNVLLFMIIAVAGFGILAIFFTIVVEKTRDIGILKSLGASGLGIMGIFVRYGLTLGMVGSGVGMILGLLFVYYIQEIADVLSWVTGQQVFDPTIYYFMKIPTIVEPHTVAWIVTGAMAIAVMASVLPAWRAARLHPVEALRYE